MKKSSSVGVLGTQPDLKDSEDVICIGGKVLKVTDFLINIFPTPNFDTPSNILETLSNEKENRRFNQQSSK